MTAAQMALLAFNERALIPTDNYDWDAYQSRLFRYALSEAYYNNIAYRNITTFSSRLKSNSDLYKHVRGIYNPVYRLVEAYTAKVYGGTLDFEDLSRGAIPITMASDELKASLRQLWLWSNWRTQKSLYVRYGAELGDVFLKVVDEPVKEKVRLEVVHPGKIKECDFDSVGNITRAVIEYEQTDDYKNWYKYTEIVDKESFATLKDGKPFIYDADETSKPQWDNPYGFVPLRLVKHKDLGQVWGGNAYHGQIGKIDEINDAASLLNDQVRKAINLIWYFSGVSRATDLDASTTDKDQIPAIYGPADSQPYPMIGNVDLTAAGVNIERLQAELERDMPELAMHRLRDAGNPTAPGIKAGFSDAIDRFLEAQGTYDDGLIAAQKMAVTIGGMRRYQGFEPFGVDSYANGDLEHFINPRPVVEDSLSKSDKVNALNTAKAPTWLILRELDYDQETIDEVESYQQEQDQKALMLAMGSLSQDTNPNDNPTDTQNNMPNKDMMDGKTSDTQNAAGQTNASNRQLAAA